MTRQLLEAEEEAVSLFGDHGIVCLAKWDRMRGPEETNRTMRNGRGNGSWSGTYCEKERKKKNERLERNERIPRIYGGKSQ